jgi:hypothetical protein
MILIPGNTRVSHKRFNWNGVTILDVVDESKLVECATTHDSHGSREFHDIVFWQLKDLKIIEDTEE